MDDDDIEDMIRDLIESGTAWTNENREAALAWLRKVSISHQAASRSSRRTRPRCVPQASSP
jgi:hypothetical protein